MPKIRFLCFILLLSLIPIAAIAVPVWKSIGPFGGSVRDIAVHPLDPSVIYAIGDRGGVFKSMDAGASWYEVNTGLPGHQALAIGLDPLDVNVAFVGLYRNGLFKTLDGGASWSRLSNGLPDGMIQTIVGDPANSSVLFVGYQEGWIYRTTDSGTSWSMVFSGSIRLKALRIAPSDSSIVVASYSDGLFRSTDGGTSWLQVQGASAGIGGFAIDPRDSNRILAASGVVQLTTDGGATWQVTYPQSVFDIKIHPANPDLVFTDRAISTDGGLTWTETSATYPCYPNWISLDPVNPAIVYSSSGFFYFIGFGICKSTDSGVTWAQSNQGLNNTIVLHHALDPYNRGRIFAHAGQSGGLFYSKNAGSTWRDTGILGNFYGSAVLVHPTIPNLVYAGGARISDPSNSIWRSTNAGATFSSISTEIQGSWTLTADPFDTQTIYATDNGVSKSVDGGFHWTALEGINAATYEVVADPHTAGLLYVATSGRGVLKSTDGGANWVPVNNGIRDLEVGALLLDTNNSVVLYASTPTGLYRTTNGGDQWRLQANGSYRPAVSPLDSQTLYAGTSNGVAVSLDAGRTWHSMGLEGYSVTHIAFDPFDPHIVYAATFGNGIYRMHLEPGGGKIRPNR